MKKTSYIQHLTFVCVSILIALIDKTPLTLDNRIGTNYMKNGFYLMYDGILDQSIEAPYSYRFLIVNLIDLIATITSFTPINLAFILNILFIYFTLHWFTIYSRQFVSPFIAFLTALILSFYIAIIQTQVIGIIIIETQDILNVLFMIGLLVLAKREQWLFFGCILALSILNRETPLILLLPFSFLLFKNKKYLPLIWINAMGVLTYLSIRFLMDVPQGSYPDFSNLKTNFPGFHLDFIGRALEYNLHLLVLLLPILYLSLKKIMEKSIQIKAIVLTIIPFMIIHYIMGSIIELRLFLPLIVLLLPIAILNLKKEFEVEK
ncbi:hypothetical protein [Aquimarina sp. RZ0]|uniref:hypothetical protein n=1 Tax=Aquimarina sp. RZ0 TaxID=2607730 RepID=UPI0011F2B3F8|nr:hypothetical protein [Aquimarina sp. RZ0]KAA1244142.1 hypothetical protein F0000_17840 [Aquimarina sp. RZ0]